MLPAPEEVDNRQRKLPRADRVETHLPHGPDSEGDSVQILGQNEAAKSEPLHPPAIID